MIWLMTTNAKDENKDENTRLDKWLWHTRFYKTRSMATAAISGGKVHLNAERIKPAHRVRIGDLISLSLQGIARSADPICASSSGWRI
jgi:ribosomal 50S subunit-recycling heat shock protein